MANEENKPDGASGLPRHDSIMDRPPPLRATGYSARRGHTIREMEAANWASLSDAELLERRISKLGLQLDGTTRFVKFREQIAYAGSICFCSASTFTLDPLRQ